MMFYEPDVYGFPCELKTISGFKDWSDPNDSCPSIGKELNDNGDAVRVFQEAKDREVRERLGHAHARFTVCFEPRNGDAPSVLCESEDWAVAKKAALKAVKEHTCSNGKMPVGR